MTNLRTREESDWQSLINQQADSAPGTYLQEGDVLNVGDGEVPGQMRVSDLRYKGYVQVWDTKTGMESLQPWWLLWQTMRKHHDDGTPAFTRTNPHISPEYGEDLTCPLSLDADPKKSLLHRGFRPCNNGRGKHHIPTTTALESHIRHSHKAAWEYMQRQVSDRFREEDRALQREAIDTQKAFLEAMMARVAGSPAPAPAPEVPTTTAVVRTRRVKAPPLATITRHNHGSPYTRRWPDCPRCEEMIASERLTQAKLGE